MAEVKDYLDAVSAAGAGPYAKLFDLTEAKSEMSFDDMATLGASIRHYARVGPGRIGPLAIVVGDSHVHLQAARFADTSVSNRPVNIFRDRQEAEAWLAQVHGR